MVTENGMGLDFQVTCARAAEPKGITMRAVFSNESEKPVRLFAMHLRHLSIHLQARRAEDGRPILPAWAPFPQVDDGSGRIDLAPGEKTIFEYRGSDYFQSLGVGKYEVRFRYQSRMDKSGEWKGTLESPWMPIEIVPQAK